VFQKSQLPPTAKTSELANTPRHGKINTAVEKGQLSVEKAKLSLVNRPPTRTPRSRQLRQKQGVPFNGLLGGARVLVVDDLFVNRKLLRIHLEKMGCEIETASDGIQAVSMSLKGNYDLIFMDIHMPYMNGIIAAREMKARIKVLPIIVGITADPSTSIRKRCLEEGMIDVLVKPIRTQQIVAVLGHIRSKLGTRGREEEPAAADAASDAATEGATDAAAKGAEKTLTS